MRRHAQRSAHLKTFREALRLKDFVLTADLPLQPEATVSDVENSAAALADVVDALQVIDDRAAVGHMSSLAAAAIAGRGGVDVVMHMTTRDRNRVALQADLLGAAALGITSLVVSRGEKLPRKDFIRGKGVFDTAETRLMAMARRISEQPELVSPPGFLLGTYVSIFDPEADWEATRIAENVETGVKFLVTQPCLNEPMLRRYMARLVELRVTHRAALIVEIPLFASAQEARNYRELAPGARIPESAIAAMDKAANGIEAGIELCAEFLAAARQIPGVSGANIRYDGPAEHVLAAIRAAGFSD